MCYQILQLWISKVPTHGSRIKKMKNFITFIFVKVIKITANILDKDSIKKYQRINPFLENIFDWKERGKLWSGNKNVTIYNSTTLVGDVEIGENTWIGPFCSIDGTGGLKIGSNCSISASVHIQTHSTVKWAISGGQESYEYKYNIRIDQSSVYHRAGVVPSAVCSFLGCCNQRLCARLLAARQRRSLLVWWNTLFVLNLTFHCVCRVTVVHL